MTEETQEEEKQPDQITMPVNYSNSMTEVPALRLVISQQTETGVTLLVEFHSSSFYRDEREEGLKKLKELRDQIQIKNGGDK